MSERDALDDFEVKFLFDSVLRQLPCDDAKMQMMLKLSHDVLVGRKSVNVATEDRSVSKALLQECVTAWKSAASRIEKGFAKAVSLVEPLINDEEPSPESSTSFDSSTLENADGSDVTNDLTTTVLNSALNGGSWLTGGDLNLSGSIEVKPLITPKSMQKSVLPYKCGRCDKRFPSVLRLELHQKFHSAERPHECRTCGRRFKTDVILRTHNLLHVPKKQYECDVCGKRFAQHATLLNHKLTHSAERRFKCDRCYSRFSLPSSLYNHRAWHSRMDALHAVKVEPESATKPEEV